MPAGHDGPETLELATPMESDAPRDTRATTVKTGAVETMHPEADDAPQDVSPEPSEEEMEDEASALGLPSPRTLGPGSDFKAFMASDVPDHLRRFALRRLWRSNPVLANVDGLVDYGEDFTDAGTVIEGMKTAYQAGKGYLRDEPDETAVAADEAEDGDLPIEDESEIARAEPGQSGTGETEPNEMGDVDDTDATPPNEYTRARITTSAKEVTKA